MSTRSRVAFALSCSLLASVLAGTFAKGDDVPETGVIKGKVTIDGKVVHHKFAIDETVVSLKGENLKKLTVVPADPVTMDQNGIAYVPTVLAIVAGTTVEFKNSDPTLHNVHCQCPLNGPVNVGMKQGETSKIKFAQPEIVEVTCNVHANMKAFIIVLDNPFFAKATKSGEFRIENVPPGEYEIKGWHDGTTPAVQKVTVAKGGETTVELNLNTKKRR